MVAPATWRRWPSASTAASSGSAAAPVTSAWTMSPQCSRIERATRAEIAATTCGSSDCRSARTIAPMPASASIRSLSWATSCCLEPTLSYTVWADTPAALAMSRTLVRA